MYKLLIYFEDRVNRKVSFLIIDNIIEQRGIIPDLYYSAIPSYAKNLQHTLYILNRKYFCYNHLWY